VDRNEPNCGREMQGRVDEGLPTHPSWRPRDLGSKKFARVLRLRWLWHEWTESDKPWVGMPIPCNDEDRRLFATAITITRGDGMTTRFWESSLLQCDSPKQIAPTIYNLSKKRTVQNALCNDAWIRDINVMRLPSVTHLQQFIQLWVRLRNVQLAPGRPDSSYDLESHQTR
jgi:hypothetical protein